MSSLKNINSNTKLIKVTLIAGIFGLFMTSCVDEKSPGVEFMPDMYRSPSYEEYGENQLFEDKMEAREPAEGSIPRGFVPYSIPNTNEGYELAGDSLKNPVPFSEETLAEGKELYTKFCMHCHGKSGKGDGKTVTDGGFPPPPAYSSPQLKDLPEGKMFHSITYGKNLMGSHASQVTQEERWKIIHYLQTLQGPKEEEKAEESGTEEAENTNEEEQQ